MTAGITFRRLRRDDFGLLAAWLAAPHVQRWWAHEFDADSVEADFGPTADGLEPAEDHLVLLDGEPVGLIQWARFRDWPEYVADMADVYPVDDAAASIDYLIGDDARIGQGLGTAMIAAFVERAWTTYPDVTHLVVPVHSDNVGSWRALEKAGFRRVAQGGLEPDNPADDERHEILRIDRPTSWPAGDDQELSVGVTDRFTAPAAGDPLDGEAVGGQRRSKLVLAPEPQGQVAAQLEPVVEPVVMRERDDALVGVGQLRPDPHLPPTWQRHVPVRVDAVPPVPRPGARVAAVEGQHPAGHEGTPQVRQHVGPLGVGHEHLRDVARHHCGVERSGRRVERRSLEPRHVARPRFGARRGERCAGRVDAGDPVAARGQAERQATRAAAEVEHAAVRAVRVDDSGEPVVVVRPGALGVVHLDEPGVLELGLFHAARLGPYDRPMTEPTVLVAQLTDSHIIEEGRTLWRRVDTAGMLAATVAHLNAMSPRPDLVVCTGDLVNDGRDEQYRNAAAILAALEIPLVLVPGNHDDRTLLRAHFPQVPAGGPHDRIDLVHDELPLRVVGLDTTVPGHGGGLVNVAQMAWLDAVLRADPDRPTLIVQHHPPFATGIAWMDEVGLTDRHLEAEVLARHPHVVGVATGHLHRSITGRCGGVPAVCSPSTGVQLALALDGTPYGYVDEQPSVTLHRWTPSDGLATHVSAVGGPSAWLPPWAPTSG